MHKIVPKSKSRQEYDLAYGRAIPIREVADILGIQITAKNKFLCPGHNDSNPSANINDQKNTFKCFACGTGGSPLDLVMHSLKVNIYGAAEFLSEYYPAIRLQEKEEISGLSRPQYTQSFYTSIGLKGNPYAAPRASFVDEARKYRDEQTRRKDPSGYKIFEEFSISEWDATGMILDKISEKQESILQEAKHILKKFPNLSPEDKEYIMTSSKEEIAEWGTHKRVFLDYLRAIEESRPELSTSEIFGIEPEDNSDRDERE